MPLTATVQAPHTHTEDWDWADTLFQGSDWYADVANQVEETEYIPETGYHVYQLDWGGCIAVTPDGNVVLAEREDLDD